jgi:hypothetical protein
MVLGFPRVFTSNAGSMPLHWKIAPLEHMVVCVAEGLVTVDDLVTYFADLEAAGAAHYRRILDATRGISGLSKADVARLSDHARSLLWRGTPGAMAVVTGASGNDTLVANVKAMLRAGRRMREFPTIHEARLWLDAGAP